MTTKNKFEFGNLSPEVREALAYRRGMGNSNSEPEARLLAEDVILEEYNRRLKTVLRRYCSHSIDPLDFATLFFQMARDLIPNFDLEKKGRGRPKKVSKTGGDGEVELPKIGTPKLVLLVQDLVRKRRCSIKDACIYLKKQKGDFYAEFRRSSAKVLETRYHELSHLYDPKEQKVRCPGCSSLVDLEDFPKSSKAE